MQFKLKQIFLFSWISFLRTLIPRMALFPERHFPKWPIFPKMLQLYKGKNCLQWQGCELQRTMVILETFDMLPIMLTMLKLERTAYQMRKSAQQMTVSEMYEVKTIISTKIVSWKWIFYENVILGDVTFREK